MITEQQKKKWIKALRSGKYKQGKAVLHNEFYSTYCCLGVLEKVCKIKRIGMCYLSPEKLPRNIQETLVQMNDANEKSFEEIADYIEKKL